MWNTIGSDGLCIIGKEPFSGPPSDERSWVSVSGLYYGKDSCDTKEIVVVDKIGK